MNRLRYLIAGLLLAAVGVAGLVVAGCSAEPNASALSSSATPASSSRSAPTAGPAAIALSRTLTGEKSWAYEPRGDVTKGRDGASRLVFAHLYRLRDKDGTPVAVFDAEQLYIGAPAARQAARDGKTIQGASYRRNAHVHRQTLPLAESCPIVAAWADQEVSGTWPSLPANLPTRDTTYWLVIDGGQVTAMVWQGY